MHLPHIVNTWKARLTSEKTDDKSNNKVRRDRTPRFPVNTLNLPEAFSESFFFFAFLCDLRFYRAQCLCYAKNPQKKQ